MKVLIVLLIFTFVQLNLAQLGFLSGSDDPFANLLKQAKSEISTSQKKLQEKEAEREKNLPKFDEGTFGNYASKFLGSTKKATAALTYGVRNTVTELTRSLISTAINNGVSLLLNEFRLISDTTGMGNQLSLPEVETVAYGFSVKATGGYFSGLSSLEKYAPINVTILDSETVILDIPVRFNEMKIGYNHLSISGFLISTSGSFTVNVEKNSILIRLKVGMDSTCAISVDKVAIDQLDGITVKLDGLGGYAGMLTAKLTNYIITWINGSIGSYIENVVDTTLNTALKDNPMICSKFTPA